mmetsp:Transcript_17401/g.53005  ORF Transcript_17401/g.53005 Transcript_17401/m.53005 type:complete len:215 (+) Transcript_17401:1321-1965(+)
MERSPAFERNKDPILDALRKTRLAECERILELASGPGEHAPFFAQQLGEASPVFQPTDSNTELLASSDAHAEAAGLLGSKVLRAKFLEVSEADWDVDDAAFDGCLAINLLHIAPHAFLEPFFRGVSKALKDGGSLGIYDTWTFDGQFVGPNNKGFDFMLRAQGFSGVPAIEACDAAAAKANMRRCDVLHLPANNQFAVYVKQPDAPVEKEVSLN